MLGRGLLHEIPDQLGMARSFSKFQARANTPAEIPGALDRAIAEIRTGRPRPTYVEVPPDIFFATGEVTIGPAVAPRARSAGDPDLIAKAAKALSSARNPLIYAGGGALIVECRRRAAGAGAHASRRRSSFRAMARASSPTATISRSVSWPIACCARTPMSFWRSVLVSSARSAIRSRCGTIRP